MKIAIVGAGLTGLTAAYELAHQGHQVVIYEKRKIAGGLAVGVRSLVPDYPDWEWNLDVFYRHLFTSDRKILQLIQKVGLGDQVKYRDTKTSLLAEQGMFPFDSAISLLSFPEMSSFNKLRTGLGLVWLRYLKNWRSLEDSAAIEYLPWLFGSEVYEKFWGPLLTKKFGQFASQVNTAWFWARIRKRSKKLGYLEGSFQRLVDVLVQEISNQNGEIRLEEEVVCLTVGSPGGAFVLKTKQHQAEKYDLVVVTIPPAKFAEICLCLDEENHKNLTQQKSAGALSLILALKEPLLKDGTYWLNINRQDIPFLSVVEHTNFQERKHFAGEVVVYLGNYFSDRQRYSFQGAEEVFRWYAPHLVKINPSFTEDWVTRKWLFIDDYAQPVFTVGYSQTMPPMKTAVSNLYYASMWQVYPWDRGMNYAVEMGEKVVEMILNDSIRSG